MKAHTKKTGLIAALLLSVTLSACTETASTPLPTPPTSPVPGPTVPSDPTPPTTPSPSPTYGYIT
ncbi:hypothetical protein, partial [Deinococcus humi]